MTTTHKHYTLIDDREGHIGFALVALAVAVMIGSIAWATMLAGAREAEAEARVRIAEIEAGRIAEQPGDGQE